MSMDPSGTYYFSAHGKDNQMDSPSMSGFDAKHSFGIGADPGTSTAKPDGLEVATQNDRPLDNVSVVEKVLGKVPKSTSGASKVTSLEGNETQISPKVWKNDYDVVHVVYSRFMQHQPNLLALGKARLELFKTFCFPTMAQQTNKQFLWMIRTDPGLHPTLKEGLIEALDGLPNVAVVGSTEIRKGSVDHGFRSPRAINDITPDTLFYGDMDLIRSFHESTAGRTVVETNLDADDGLGLTFVERAQKLALSTFERIHDGSGWMNLCVGRHFEWQFYAPWDKKTEKGSLRAGSTHICVTPGLSWATQANAQPRFITGHHLVKKQTPSCEESNEPFLGCWAEIPVPDPDTDVMAIRARTPTSTGMNSVVLSDAGWDQTAFKLDKQAWPLLQPSFAITETSVRVAHKHLSDHLKELVAENLAGQCTKDHSCSEAIKKQLKSIFFTSGKWENKHDLVHVVHMEFPAGLDASKQHFLAFEPMEAQTTYEFLLILYIQDTMDANFRNNLMKMLKKSPLDMIVVESNGGASTIDFRKPEAIAGFASEKIIYGNVTLLEDYHRAAKNRTVLETSLSAFEAIRKTFMEEIETETASQLSKLEGNAWYYQCVSDYIEWRYYDPRGQESSHGFLKVADQPNEKCVERPGSTRISLPGAEIPDDYKKTESEECQPAAAAPRSGCFVRSGRREAVRALFPAFVAPSKISLQVSDNELAVLEAQQQGLRAELHGTYSIVRGYLSKLCELVKPDMQKGQQ